MLYYNQYKILAHYIKHASPFIPSLTSPPLRLSLGNPHPVPGPSAYCSCPRFPFNWYPKFFKRHTRTGHRTSHSVNETSPSIQSSLPTHPQQPHLTNSKPLHELRLPHRTLALRLSRKRRRRREALVERIASLLELLFAFPVACLTARGG